MDFVPKKDGEIAVDGSGQNVIKFKKGVSIDLPDHLVAFLKECGYGNSMTLEDKISSFKKIVDIQAFAEKNNVELEAKTLVDMKTELLGKMK